MIPPANLDLDPDDPFALIGYAMMTSPGSVVALPLYTPAAPDRELILKAKLRRQTIPPAVRAQMQAESTNGRDIPTHVEVGRALTILPSDVVRNIRGEEAKRDVLWLVMIRREVYERAKSGLVVPGAMSRIVIPGPGGMG